LVPTDTLRTLVVSLVLTRLDFGNSVLAGFPVYLTRRLQSVLNAAARLTYYLRRSDHITDALVCLHWAHWLCRSEFSSRSPSWRTVCTDSLRNTSVHSIALLTCLAVNSFALPAPADP